MNKEEILAKIESISSSDIGPIKKFMAIEDLNFAYNMLTAVETGALDFGKPKITLTSAYKETNSDSRGVRTVLHENWESPTC